MYFVIYFLAGIVLFTFIVLKFVDIIFDKKSYSSPYYHIYAILLFLVMIATFINIIIAVTSYRKTSNIAGIPGKRGIKGHTGKRGAAGKCDEDCGQKVCYIDIIDEANKTFQEIVTKLVGDDNNGVSTKTKKSDFKINNAYFLDIINSICKSKQYKTILLGKHPKKPSEQKLIKHLKKSVREWVNHILDITNVDDRLTGVLEEQHKGVRFLLEPNWNRTMMNFNKNGITRNPFDELEKYDIWNWSQGLTIKPLQIDINVKNLEKPEPDTARLYIKKSNNYNSVFDSSAPKDKWDDKNCQFNQMGADRTNPHNLSKCVFMNSNFLKDYVNTWKTDVYQKDTELSLYTAQAYRNQNNQEFYPVGSVWRGNENTKKPPGVPLTPSSKNSCGYGHGKDGLSTAKNEGPEKETLLVSGDVQPPTDFELIWDNKVGCPECQNNKVKIYRPIAPEGYVCMGDYATNGDKKTDINLDPEQTNIRCVPKDCVKEAKIGNRFWNNKNISYDKYDSYENYISKKPYSSDTQLTASFWTAGMDNIGVGEEQKNNYGMNFENNDGYNLFRTSKNLKRPKKLKSYIIKDKCLRVGGGKEPVHPEVNYKHLKKNSTDTSNREKTDGYFGGKPGMAIVTNQDSSPGTNKHILNINNKPLRMYIIDDLNKTEKKENGGTEYLYDTYFIAIFNPNKNDFSNYVVTNQNGEIEVTDNPNRRNKYHRWVIETPFESDPQPPKQSYDSNIYSFGLHLKGSVDNKYLKHEYDAYGLGERDIKTGKIKNHGFSLVIQPAQLDAEKREAPPAAVAVEAGAVAEDSWYWKYELFVGGNPPKA